MPQETLPIRGPKAGRVLSPQTLLSQMHQGLQRKRHQKEGPAHGGARSARNQEGGPDSLPSLSCVTSSRSPHPSEPPSLMTRSSPWESRQLPRPAPQAAGSLIRTADTLCWGAALAHHQGTLPSPTTRGVAQQRQLRKVMMGRSKKPQGQAPPAPSVMPTHTSRLLCWLGMGVTEGRKASKVTYVTSQDPGRPARGTHNHLDVPLTAQPRHAQPAPALGTLTRAGRPSSERVRVPSGCRTGRVRRQVSAPLSEL